MAFEQGQIVDQCEESLRDGLLKAFYFLSDPVEIFLFQQARCIRSCLYLFSMNSFLNVDVTTC